MILIWCLAPAYWMVVTAFREVGFTYDTSVLPTHVTLDNFNTAFDTSFGTTSARRCSTVSSSASW